MNLKDRPFLFAILFAFTIAATNQTRTCKTQLVRSFTLHARVTPNRTNAVCPSITLNCCSTHDQMKMHKMWTEHANPHITARHKKSLASFSKLRAVVAFKDKLNLKGIVKAYGELAKPTPSTEVLIHLDKVVKEFGKIKGKVMMENMKTLPKKYNRMLLEVKHLRKGVLCGVCEWHNHRYFDAEARAVTYNEKFCFKLVQRYIDVLWMKYGEIVKFLMLLDEFFFIVTEQRLMEEDIDRAVFHRYILLLDKCKKSPENIKACEDVCRQFNVNRFTYLFDGESLAFDEYVKRFMDVVDVLTGDKDDFLKLFALRKKNWSKKIFEQFAKTKTHLNKKVGKDPFEKKAKKTGFNLRFVSQVIKGYVERRHPLNTVQIETFEDEIESTMLYKLVDHPIDVAGFDIEFSANGGVNLFRDSKKLNLDLSVHKILAIIQLKGKGAETLDEVMDDGVKKMLMGLKITDLANFLVDKDTHFKRMIFPKEGGYDTDEDSSSDGKPKPGKPKPKPAPKPKPPKPAPKPKPPKPVSKPKKPEPKKKPETIKMYPDKKSSGVKSAGLRSVVALVGVIWFVVFN